MKGICFMAFNQQGDEQEIKDLKEKIVTALDGFIPFITNFKELKEKGWNVKFDEENEHVHTLVDEDETNEKQYKYAWSTCPREKVDAIVKIIRETEWLYTEKALDVFVKVTGLSLVMKSDDEEAAIKLLTERGRLRDGKVVV
jgi:hypothetical protein